MGIRRRVPARLDDVLKIFGTHVDHEGNEQTLLFRRDAYLGGSESRLVCSSRRERFEITISLNLKYSGGKKEFSTSHGTEEKVRLRVGNIIGWL